MSPLTSEFPSPWHDALTVLLSIILSLVLIEQILTLKILRQRDNDLKRLTPYLINLAVTTLIFALSSFTFLLGSNLSGRYIANKTTCMTFGYIACTAVLVIFTTFAACTVTVYNTLSKLTATHIITGRKDTKIVVGIWFYCLLNLIPVVIIWNKDTYHPGIFGCLPIWTLKTPGDIAYLVILTFFGFLLPLILNFVYSAKIYLLFSNIKLAQMTYHQQRRYHDYKKVSKMMIAAAIVYIICWTPFTIIALLSMAGYSLSPGLTVIPYLLSKSSVVFSPIIYAIFNANFRAAILNLFCCRSRSSQVSPMEPNCAGLQTPPIQHPPVMVPRSPVMCSETTPEGPESDTSPACSGTSSTLGSSRKREVLLHVNAGVRIYSLE